MQDRSQTADGKPVTFYQGMKPAVRRKVEPIIQETTAAYKRLHPNEAVPDFSTAEGGRHAQELVENLADANRRFHENLNSNSAESRG